MAECSVERVSRYRQRPGTGGNPIRRERGTSAIRDDSYSKLPSGASVVVEPNPGQRLRELLIIMIAQLRGSQIATPGAVDLLQRDVHDPWLRTLEAVQTVLSPSAHNAAHGWPGTKPQRAAAGPW